MHGRFQIGFIRARVRPLPLDRKDIAVALVPAAMFMRELATEALGKDGLKAYGSMTAFQRMGAPAELGAAAAFLASSDSSFMTASEVAVDGGLAQL